MNRSTLWLLCMLGCAIFSQGLARPQEDYQEDGDGDDYDDTDEEPAGPPPRIKSTGTTQILDVGGVAIFPCEVEAGGNLRDFSRLWRRGNKTVLFLGSIAQNQDPRINLLGDGSLEIRQVEPSDEDVYSCMISSDKGQEVVYTLHIKSPAKITRISPSEKTVIRKGSSLTLECFAQGYPTPSVKWFRNGHMLDNSDPPVQGNLGARYTIRNASLEDAGSYKCTAANIQHQPDEEMVEIVVHYPPQIEIARAIVPTGEGLTSELKCTVTGMQKPELRWYRNEDQKPIVPSSKYEIVKHDHEHILRIHKTDAPDFGDYVCEAKNLEGQEQAVITLTGKPSRPELSSSSVDGESKNPVLVFEVESFSGIEDSELLYKKEEKDEWITVKLNVIPPSEPNDRIYTIKHVLQNLEPGVYNAQLKVKNKLGWSEMSNKVTFPKEHDGDLTETGLLALDGTSSASELRISLALVMSLFIAHFYC